MSLPRILLVDDKATNLALLEEQLEGRYMLASMQSGAQAQQVALSFVPDLVLLDVMMPGLDGFQTHQWRRAHTIFSKTKVVMV